MNSKPDTHNLLHSLYELYIKISHYDWHKRRQSYRPVVTEADISQSLKKNIDRLSENQHSIHASSTGRSFLDRIAHEPLQSQTPLKLISKMLHGLTRHYKNSTSHIEANQFMSNKLKTSIWSHIHIAFMQARQGDVAAAKVHADIATQALKLAAHYMSEDDYKLLYVDVVKALNTFNDQKKTQSR
ncbi:MAG: hypothetical protein OEZ38_08600 [Gammaproteobacteria bacterium]|nr:hypothetical protein [Gammaproteobacteria bacterium]